MKYYRIFFLIVLTVLVLAACSPSPAATVLSPAPQATAGPATTVVEPTVPASATAESSSPAIVATEPAAAAPTLSDAEMEALITEKAHDKHTLDFILLQNMTAEQWSKTLDRMIGYGTKISPEEKTLIINWLVSRNK